MTDEFLKYGGDPQQILYEMYLNPSHNKIGDLVYELRYVLTFLI